jgi:hypothetical protein
MSLIKQEALEAFDTASFTNRQPCPWSDFDGLLTDEAFDQLCKEFPSLDLFERHNGISRKDSQRPHDRYYLAFEHSLYGNKKPGQVGCIGIGDLSPVWQQFIEELQSSPIYRRFVQQRLDAECLAIRFAWHVAGPGNDVSPHCDAASKAGTHIFYFNTSDDWDDAWGGSTLFLSGKKTEAMNPEVSDFEQQYGFSIVNNKSMLFRNTPNAWHGVDRISCPPGKYRRIFNVIFEKTSNSPSELIGGQKEKEYRNAETMNVSSRLPATTTQSADAGRLFKIFPR